MKCYSLLFCLLSLSATTSFAGINAANGFYIGGDLAFTIYDPVDGAAMDSSLIAIDGYIRPYIGYRFTDYLAIEGGFDYLVNDHNAGGKATIPGTSGPDHYKLTAIDLAGKIIYPFVNGLSVFGKAGFAVVHQDVFNQTYQNDEPEVDTNTTRLMPLVGVGASYNFTQRIAAEISYVHIQRVNPIKNIEILGAGLSYTF
jgi:opacity protein-like surface antigen